MIKKINIRIHASMHLLLLGGLTAFIFGCHNAMTHGTWGDVQHTYTIAQANNSSTKPAFAIQLSNQPQRFRRSALYYLLLAEIAWSRDLPFVAIKHYQYVLDRYPDAKIAERTTQFALLSNALTPATKAATQWAHLAPDNKQALVIAISLLIQSEQMAQAEQFLEQLIKFDTKDIVAGSTFISSYLRTPAHKQQFHVLVKKLHHKHPNNLNAQYLLALSSERIGERNTAKAILKKALSKQSNWPAGITLYIQMLQQDNALAEAMQFLKGIVKQHPGLGQSRQLYADMLRQTNNLDEAKAQYQPLLNDPQYKTTALVALIEINLIQHNPGKAKQYTMQLQKAAPLHLGVDFYLGQAAELEGDYDTALAKYHAVDNNLYFLSAQIKLALIYAVQGKADTALVRLARLLEQYPKNFKQIELTRIQILMDKGEHNHVLNQLDGHLKKAPNDVEYLYARALAASVLKQMPIVERDLTHILRLAPDHADALNALGYFLTNQTSRYDEALDYIKKALALAPHNPAIIDSMGWVLYHLNKHEQAIQYLRRAHEQSQDPEITAHLGEVLWVSGERHGALTLLREALKKNPKHKSLLDVMHRYDLK